MQHHQDSHYLIAPLDRYIYCVRILHVNLDDATPANNHCPSNPSCTKITWEKWTNIHNNKKKIHTHTYRSLSIENNR